MSAHRDQEGNLLIGGEAPQRRLGEHQGSVHDHLEDAALALDELDLGIVVGLLQLGGQTDRLGEVVSVGAVLDGDLHGSPGLLGPGADSRPPVQVEPTV